MSVTARGRVPLTCGSRYHRERASLWAHALEVAQRCGGENSLHDLVGNPNTRGGPRLVCAPYPEVLIAKAQAEGDSLYLVLYPGADDRMPLIELGGLMPERHYRTGHESEPRLKADKAGRAVLRIPLHGRTPLTIEPSA